METTISCFAPLCHSDPNAVPHIPNPPRFVRRLPAGIQLVGFKQSEVRVFVERKPSNRCVHRQRTQ